MPSFPSIIPQLLFIDPIGTYGCAFDHRVVFDGAASTGANTKITSATAAFVAADLNKRIVLTGAGASGAMYVGTVTNIDSATQVTVSPVISTTVSAKGLQIHTDDLAAWTNLINDLNNSTYPGGVIQMRSAGPVTGFTNRSGVSSVLPTITKTVHFEGIGGGHNADIGDYTKAGGSCIAYVGTTAAPTAFGAFLTIAPTLGVTAQSLKQVILSHFWLDCRNGDGSAALKGLSLQSCSGFEIDDFFVIDAAAVAMEFTVVAPGVATPAAGSLGEAKDCTRGHVRNSSVRVLDSPTGAQITAVTTTTAVALSNGTPQTLAGIGANTLTTSGYAWVATACGYPVLVNYTGGGGGASLTGCTVSVMDAINAPTTVSGSNIVQAVPGNACAMFLTGDAGANANLTLFENIQISHGTTWGPAAVEFGNSDSIDMINFVINGGNNTNDGAINRIRKPGVRLNGSNTSATLASRNNTFRGGSAGGNPIGTPPGANFGGVSNMGLLNTGAHLLAQAGPNYWDLYQLGNGEPVPIIEGNSAFQWTPNGGFVPGVLSCNPLAQTAIVNAITQVTGSLIAIPPQGLQVGTLIRWTISGTTTPTATATNIVVRMGTAGTTADAAIATDAPTSAAVTGVFKLVIELSIRTIGAAGAGSGYCTFHYSSPLATGGIQGAVNVAIREATMAAFTTTTAQQYLSVSILTGAAGSSVTPRTCFVECLKPASP